MGVYWAEVERVAQTSCEMERGALLFSSRNRTAWCASCRARVCAGYHREECRACAHIAYSRPRTQGGPLGNVIRNARGIITVSLSPFEQRAFAGFTSTVRAPRKHIRYGLCFCLFTLPPAVRQERRAPLQRAGRLGCPRTRRRLPRLQGMRMVSLLTVFDRHSTEEETCTTLSRRQHYYLLCNHCNGLPLSAVQTCERRHWHVVRDRRAYDC